MISIKRYLFFGVVMLTALGSSVAQQSRAFEERLVTIDNELNLLADSVAPGLRETANFSVSGISIQSFLRTLAENHNLNLQVDPMLQVTMSNNFTSVTVKDIISFLCREYRLDIHFINNILSFSKYETPVVAPPPPPQKKLAITVDNTTGRISFDLSGDSLRSVVRAITRISDRNVISSGSDLEGKLVTGYIKDLPLESALDKLAYSNSMRLSKTRDGVFIFESNASGSMSGNPSNTHFIPRSANQNDIVVKDSLISLDLMNYPILEVINQVSGQLGISTVFFTEITGNTTAKVTRIRYRDMLSLLFQGTNFTYKQKELIYLVGARNQEGFRSSEIIKLNFRTIDGVEKEIPTELMKDVEMKIVRELNSFVFTGNRLRIDEIISFIKLIDQPVPNILIEVIVAEANKNFTIQTGIKAILSDSTVKTGGTLFPGVDMTLSSKSINNVLDKLTKNGIVNLGHVAPNFSATIQALETNNNIQVRSTPKLSAMNGSKANLVIGESQYYAEQTQNVVGGVAPINSTSQRYTKVEANLSISISPVVSGNEHITLDIIAEFSGFTPRLSPTAPPGTKTKKFESKIRVRNEEVIILGGLEELSKSESGSGVPFLSRVPVIKWFFSSKTKTNSDNRLIIFIKPTLVY